MKKLILILSTLLASSALHAQGSLTPPGSPAPTMKTLQQIEPRIDISTLPGDRAFPDAMHVIKKPGSYYLTEEILASINQTAIQVTTSNVTIDLNGFALRQSTGLTGSGIRITANESQIVVKNGLISAFNYGIEGDYSNAECRIEDLQVTNVYAGCYLGQRTIVRNCQFSASGTTYRGVRVADGSIVEDCTIFGFDDYGVFAASTGILRNLSIRYCGGGIYGTSANTITDCSVSFTLDVSKYAIFSSTNTTVRKCTIGTAAFKGIYVSSDSVVDDCVVYNTESDGISTGTNSMISNCSVSNSRGAIAGIYTGSNSMVTNCIADNCDATGIKAQIGSTVKDCIAKLNGGTGIHQHGDGGVIESCESIDNGGYGIAGGDNVVISNCTATGNTGGYGIHAGYNARIVNCNASNNTSSLNSSCGIFAFDNSLVSGCVVNENLSTIVPSIYYQGVGIMAGNKVRIENCMVSGNSGDGIYAQAESTIVNNNCTHNGNSNTENMDGAGIHAVGTYSVIEGNTLVGNERGINADNPDNLIIKNRAGGNAINYRIGVGNRIGTLVSLSSNSVEVNGSTGDSGLGTTDPWANFSF